MMREVYTYLICLIGSSFLGLAGCTTGLVEDVIPEEAELIRLDFGSPNLGELEVITRAGTSTTTPLPAGATVRVVAYYLGCSGESVAGADFSSTPPYTEATYVVGTDGSLSPCLVNEEGKLIEGTPKTMYVRSGIYDFYAVSPARRLSKNGMVWGISGLPHREDVMTSYARSVAVTKGNARIRLESFVRKCALVVFTVTPAPGQVAMTRLKGTGLSLSEVSCTGAGLRAGISESIAKTGGTEGSAGTIIFASGDFEPVVPASDLGNLGLNKVIGEILPKDGQSFSVAITVERNGIPVELRAVIDKNITFDEGKRYVFTLQVYNDVSRLSLRVLGWTEFRFTNDMGGRTAQVLKADDPRFDPDICEGFGEPLVVAEWEHVDWNGKK